MNYDINSRIYRILDEVFEGNVSRMAQHTYIKRTTINSIVGEQQVTPGYDILSKIADMSSPKINIEWLITGEGPMIDQKSNIDSIPLVPVDAYAGLPEAVVSECLTSDDCDRIASPFPGAKLAIQVNGDSMEPKFHSGSYLYLAPISLNLFIPWGTPLVLDTENGAVVKALYPIENDNTAVEARSFNPKYPPFKIPVECIRHAFRIVGVATSVVTL